MTLTRFELLARARTVLDERQLNHGEAMVFLKTFAGLVGVLLDRPVSLIEADLILTALKLARAKCKPGHADNWVDLIGYAAIGGEIAALMDKGAGA